MNARLIFPENTIYPASSKLQKIIREKGWSLYDITRNVTQQRSSSFEEMDLSGYSKEFVIGHLYVLLPSPRKNQTLKNSFDENYNLGPSLKFTSLDDERWDSFYVDVPKLNQFDWRVNFSMLSFQSDSLVAFSSMPAAVESEEMLLSEPDRLFLKYEYVLTTFREDLQRIAPPKRVSRIGNFHRMYHPPSPRQKLNLAPLNEKIQL